MARPAIAPADRDGTLSEAPRACPSCGRTFPPDYLVCPRDGAPLGIAANETDPLVGIVIGGSYRIERAIARGGMGRLYEGEHTRLPRKVAIKVLHEPHAQKPEAVRRFEREASALSRIDHPHVLGVLDFVRTPDGRGAIVTPLLAGENLQSRLDREGSLAEGEAVRLAIEMCRGLAAAHAEGIVHRDLKPSNVFLAKRAEDDHAHVKLLDFGVAKLSDDDMTRTGVVLGTPAYMAPEQASGSAKVDARADVYAVGAVLYRMLVGAMPYDGDDAGSVLAQLLAGPPQRLGSRGPVREAIEAIVERAMARAPSDRFATAADLAEALASVVETDVTRTPRTSTRSRAVPRERALTIALVGSAAAIAGGWLAGLVHLGAQGLGVTSERTEALATALVLVGVSASVAGVIFVLGREVHVRFGSATELRLFRARIGGALRAGLVALGAAELVRAAIDSVDPWLDVAALAVAITTFGLTLWHSQREAEVSPDALVRSPASRGSAA